MRDQNETIQFFSVRRVSHEQDLQREAQFWAARSIAERVIAGWALAEGSLLPREDHQLAKRTGWTLRRVARSGRLIHLDDAERLELAAERANLELPDEV